MMKFGSILTTVALAALATGAANADPGKGRGKGKGPKADAVVDVDVNIGERRRYSRLGDYERDILRDYYGRGNCPPGLAKKNNGCLPPGIAKKRYEVGHPLGDDIYIQPLPYELRTRLPILPDPYGYRLVDGDLLVVELATLVVLDALNFY